MELSLPWLSAAIGGGVRGVLGVGGVAPRETVVWSVSSSGILGKLKEERGSAGSGVGLPRNVFVLCLVLWLFTPGDLSG